MFRQRVRQHAGCDNGGGDLAGCGAGGLRLHPIFSNDAGAARRTLGICALALFLLTAPTGADAACEKSPRGVDIERTLYVDPTLLPRVGTLQYPVTLPLRDHEVVLTFDDGPAPSTTGKVLDALSAECVPAIFFVVGERAMEAPNLVVRAATEGHAIGTHTQRIRTCRDLRSVMPKRKFEKGSSRRHRRSDSTSHSHRFSARPTWTCRLRSRNTSAGRV